MPCDVSVRDKVPCRCSSCTEDVERKVSTQLSSRVPQTSKFEHDGLHKSRASLFVQHCPTNIMYIVVGVGLLSGRTLSVEARLDESLAILKRRAQTGP